jgi:hypothetical protein
MLPKRHTKPAGRCQPAYQHWHLMQHSRHHQHGGVNPAPTPESASVGFHADIPGSSKRLEFTRDTMLQNDLLMVGTVRTSRRKSAEIPRKLNPFLSRPCRRRRDTLKYYRVPDKEVMVFCRPAPQSVCEEAGASCAVRLARAEGRKLGHLLCLVRR